LAGADGQPGREVGFASAGWAKEHDVVAGGDEVQRAEVSEQVTFEPSGVIEVEFLQRCAGREAGRADAALPAV
jgi:hypothetical protein